MLDEVIVFRLEGGATLVVAKDAPYALLADVPAQVAELASGHIGRTEEWLTTLTRAAESVGATWRSIVFGAPKVE